MKAFTLLLNICGWLSLLILFVCVVVAGITSAAISGFGMWVLLMVIVLMSMFLMSRR